jgi:flagellar basal-body rod modification protein FlgD
MTTTDALDPNIARSTGTTTGGIYTAIRPDAVAPDNKLGKDSFLKLLVAQMKYQDPMNPASATDFIAQTAQFTVVEQLASMAKQSDELLASQQMISATSFIGRDVMWTTKDDTGADVSHEGNVTGVSFTADGPLLRVGDEDVPMSSLKAVAPMLQPAPAAPPNDSTTDGASTGTDAATPTDPTN